MDITALIRTPIVILALLLAFSACGPSKPVGPTPDELKRQAEQQELDRLRAAEQERQAKIEAERKAAEEVKRKEEAVALPPEFGKPNPPDAAAVPPSETVPGTRAPATASSASGSAATVASAGGAAAGSSTASTGATATSGMPPLIASSGQGSSETPTVPYDQAFPPIPDRLLRVAVVSSPSQANVAERIGTMLAVTEKDRLEDALGMGLQIAYLSQSDRDPKLATRIQYREKYLQAAVRLASMIPQAQKVERMTESDANRMGVDVLIQVGSDLH